MNAKVKSNMSILPLEPRLKTYNGSNEKLTRKNNEHNRTAKRVVRHLNELIANNDNEDQQYFWADIAHDLEIGADEVQSAVRYGGHHGITLRVAATDRAALAWFKRAPS